MSQWSHVNIALRVDSLRLFAGNASKPNLCEALEIETIPHPWVNGVLHDAVPALAGSEGTCEASIWENPSESSVAAYAVQIVGDLRSKGVETVTEVLEYLNRVTAQLAPIAMNLRSGIAEIDVEYHHKTYLVHSGAGWTLLATIDTRSPVDADV